jgi:8-oxo-dGTP pyrophosphatase MutT (NUDIX family)
MSGPEAMAIATPRLAATVVLIRRAAIGPEVLMVRRTRQASFMADAFVFPGGRVEPEDEQVGEDTFARAAARELREEAGVEMDPGRLIPFARWITPSAEPKRFDARFYLAVAPEGQVARHDAVEAVEHLWATPTEMLARHTRAEIKLPPPTLHTLAQLAQADSVDACLSWARDRPIVAIQPKLVPLADTLAIVLPWDPEYEALPGEGAAISPDHPVAFPPSRLLLRDGRWRAPG